MQRVVVATRLHQDSPDLAECCRDASLIGSQLNPAGAQIDWQHQHKKEVEDTHAKCLSTAVGLRRQRLFIKIVLDLELDLLETAHDFILVFMDTSHATPFTLLQIIFLRHLVYLHICLVHFQISLQIIDYN